MSNSANNGKSTQFKAGNQVAKGKGRIPMSDDEKKAKALTRTEFNNIVREHLNLTIEELDEKLKQLKKLKLLDAMVLGVMNKAMIEGDQTKLNWFLEQLFGKLKESKDITLTGPNGGPVEVATRIDYSKLDKKQLETMLEVAKIAAISTEEDE